MPSYNTRSRTKNAESNDDDAAQKKSGNANIESTPASVAKKPPPSTSATGKAKTTKTKPGPISAEARAALIAGINKGDKYLDQFETNDEIKQLIKSIVPVRVTGKNRDPLLTKLKQALRLVSKVILFFQQQMHTNFSSNIDCNSFVPLSNSRSGWVLVLTN